MKCSARAVVGAVALKSVVFLSRRERRDDADIVLAYVTDRTRELIGRIDEAMALIRKVDARRAERMQRDLSCILILRSGGPEFLSPISACLLSEQLVLSSTVTGLALMIVHEAAHARLWRRGLRYQHSVRDRVERICIREELAFAQRLPEAEVVVPWVKQKLESIRHLSDKSLSLRRQKDLDGLALPKWVRRLLR